ncbi:TIR domain-containing protein [Actinokineospora cianjurensis]|uniref:Putative nucleotide-binding protein with TIR-like domain n=1 Tax=Actinokineospora cianjurensis TaxID=585224 RepID=A0A421B8Z2_9PSEU|nr:TIR domain-containing protein [Actinokineospora cianjurensis]RLK60891.1 putative nucleotide-binding protein with TIR-like domain [Actinokineospora cianjurensis]
MSYFHIRLSVVGSPDDEVKLDLTPEQLESQFLAPYRAGRTITVNGTSIPGRMIGRLRVSVSETPSKSLIQDLRVREASSLIASVGGHSLRWRAASQARDVTDEYIVGPPGGLPELGSDEGSTSPAGDKNKVFLVHGRDTLVVAAMKQFLRSLGLSIVEREHVVNHLGTPNPYVGAIVREGFDMADAAVILFTPDEVVSLRPDLTNDSDGEPERAPQAQSCPDVYYEAGIADTIDHRRTVLVEVGRVKPFGDVAGRHVVRFDGTASKRGVLAGRLKTAGLAINKSGTDWLSDGDFESPLRVINEALKYPTN